jgi:MBG domain (YGX type)/Putative peptidoglycan binding domain/MBG domain
MLNRHLAKGLAVIGSVFVLSLFIGSAPALSASRYAVATGNWGATTTWSDSSGGVAGASVPIAGDAVYIGESVANRAVTIASGYSAACASLEMGTTTDNTIGTLDFADGTSALAVSGNIQMNRPSSAATTTINIGAGSLAVNSDLTLAYHTVSATGNARVNKIAISTGVLTIGGNLFLEAEGAGGLQSQIVFSDAGIMNIAGNFTLTNNRGVLTPSTGTVNFNGTSAQTIPVGVSAVIYNNVNINNTSASGTTLSASITAASVTGNISVGNISSDSLLILGNHDISFGDSKALTVAYGSTMRAGTGVVTFGTSGTAIIDGTFRTANVVGFSGSTTAAINSTNSPVISLGANSIIQYTAGVAQAVTARSDYANLTFTGLGEKTMAAGTTTLSGNWHVTGGASMLSTNNSDVVVVGNITGTGDITSGSGTIILEGDWTNSGTFTAGTGAVDYKKSSGGQTVGGVVYNILTLSNTSGAQTAGGNIEAAVLNKVSATGILNMGVHILSATTVNNAGIIRTQNTSANPIPAGKTWGGTVHYNNPGGSQTIVAGTYNKLTIAQGFGGSASLDGDVDVDGVLALTSGAVSTGAYTMYVGSAGSVSRTTGHINGNLKKYITTGGTSKTFEVGDGLDYAPVAVSFGNVSGAGDLTIKTISGTHPNIGSSTLSPSKYVNRYWVATDSGIAFDNYTAVLNFVGGDIIGGADPDNFVVGKYNGGWTYPTVGSTNSTDTEITGLTSFSDFQIAEHEKIDPTVSITNSPVTYNGSTQAAAVSGSVAGVVSDVKYDGFGTVPTDAGTYAVTADFLPDDTINYNSLDDASAGNFIIGPKLITITAVAKSKFEGASDPALTYNSSDGSAAFTGALTRVAGETVGIYAISQGTLAVVGSNYSIFSFIPATLTIASVGGGSFSLPSGVGDGAADFSIPMGATENIGNVGGNGINLLAYINSVADFTALVSHNYSLEEHSLTIIGLDLFNNIITIRIDSASQVFILNLADTVKVDLDNDKILDVSVKFEDVYISRAELTIKSLLAQANSTPAETIQKFIFTRNLKLGMVHADVKELQRYLNFLGFAVSASGAGSAGNETTMFGAKTRAAVIKFQKAKGIAPAVGYFGPITRGVMNAL